MKKTQINFDAKALTKTLVERHVQWQTELLIDYAQRTINEIGDKISSYHKGNNMFDTGNLLDSICWGVMYNAKLIQSGFYGERRATQPSYLHSRSMVTFVDPIDPKTGKRKAWKKYGNDEQIPWVETDAGEPVDGRKLAKNFIAKQAAKGKTGAWQIFFAVLAPYWGYWEKGFNLKGRHTSTFVQFAVMTEVYDKVKADLKPAKRSFRTVVAKYASKSLYRQAKKNY